MYFLVHETSPEQKTNLKNYSCLPPSPLSNPPKRWEEVDDYQARINFLGINFHFTNGTYSITVMASNFCSKILFSKLYENSKKKNFNLLKKITEIL